MAPQDKVNKLIELLQSGKTIHIHTCTRVTEITPKTYKRWAKNGHVLFKADDKSVYMANGNKFVCIDYNPITVVE